MSQQTTLWNFEEHELVHEMLQRVIQGWPSFAEGHSRLAKTLAPLNSIVTSNGKWYPILDELNGILVVQTPYCLQQDLDNMERREVPFEEYKTLYQQRFVEYTEYQRVRFQKIEPLECPRCHKRFTSLIGLRKHKALCTFEK